MKGGATVLKNKNRTYGNYRTVVVGIVVSILLCLIGLLAIANIVVGAVIGEKGTILLMALCMALSSIVGEQIAVRGVKERKTTFILVIGGTLTAMMVLGGMLIDGKSVGAVWNPCSVVIGTSISCMMCLKKLSGSKNKNRWPR